MARPTDYREEYADELLAEIQNIKDRYEKPLMQIFGVQPGESS